ncbi:RNR2 and RNR3 transcriptional regulator [Komagataella phaffii CBS 7435]|uniref:Uncharacterized protein n=2 Tax=Komagataella phaffii TaxID=460519 RepID=C4R6A6_KOMPG|nr:Hypothetical protein PAS_chr3_1029 [Komagataella phaffii GS115]AOA64226.1 GQ67_04160T0 [Komagataella phaffii]CAH2449069.1 RNR2 and RNR3 transcriptional regulator [Komagataella phaffii CBS 7435]AOA69052.1 GQ68_04133T0 [Komagataella phaffii GS115]CAY71092.1 Hypothetical protein PAS_chr3_1029 [Komagataella phaffii GS115]CCA39111.1 RNR2 and RNR3 transcriptional regulator [Komagataella phaffii CBS 7435]
MECPPGRYYNDSIVLQHTDEISLVSHNENSEYKNNLVAISKVHPLLFLSYRRHIQIYRLPQLRWITTISTVPEIPAEWDTSASVFPDLPYDINYCRIGEINGKEVLAIASDNGTVKLYYTDALSKLAPNPRIIKVAADLELRLKRSVWGLDFYPKYNMIAVSSNSHYVTVFRILPDEKFIFGNLATLSNNIPTVCFIKNSTDSKTEVRLMAGSVQGEVAYFRIDVSQHCENEIYDLRLIKDSPVDHGNFKSGINSSILSCCLFSEMIWTLTFVSSEFFKPVDSLGIPPTSSSKRYPASDEWNGVPVTQGGCDHIAHKVSFSDSEKPAEQHLSDVFSDGSTTQEVHFQPSGFCFGSAELMTILLEFDDRRLKNRSSSLIRNYLRDRFQHSCFIPELSSMIIVGMEGTGWLFRLVQTPSKYTYRQELCLGTTDWAPIVGVDYQLVDDNTAILYMVNMYNKAKTYKLVDREIMALNIDLY